MSNISAISFTSVFNSALSFLRGQIISFNSCLLNTVHTYRKRMFKHSGYFAAVDTNFDCSFLARHTFFLSPLVLFIAWCHIRWQIMPVLWARSKGFWHHFYHSGQGMINRVLPGWKYWRWYQHGVCTLYGIQYVMQWYHHLVTCSISLSGG